EEGQQLLDHPVGTLLGNPMAASLSYAAAHVLGNAFPGLDCPHSPSAPMLPTIADHGHFERTALFQQRLVVGHVLRCCTVEVEARPHCSRQAVGTYVFLLGLERDCVGARTPVAVEEAEIDVLAPCS